MTFAILPGRMNTAVDEPPSVDAGAGATRAMGLHR